MPPKFPTVCTVPSGTTGPPELLDELDVAPELLDELDVAPELLDELDVAPELLVEPLDVAPELLVEPLDDPLVEPLDDPLVEPLDDPLGKRCTLSAPRLQPARTTAARHTANIFLNTLNSGSK